MNIFALDSDPQLCAAYHTDIHVRKMVIETAQMLSTVSYLHSDADLQANWTWYKPSYINHPCVKWLQQAQGNYEWLVQFFQCLNFEYMFRFNKRENHKSFEKLIDLPFPLDLPKKELQYFERCMPEEYKTWCDVRSYRNYYKFAKRFDKNGKLMHIWTNRGIPYWILDQKKEEYPSNFSGKVIN
jgi:hypothetical protein